MSEVQRNVVFVHGPEYAKYWVDELNGDKGTWKIEGNVVAHHDFITIYNSSLQDAQKLILKVYASSTCPVDVILTLGAEDLMSGEKPFGIIMRDWSRGGLVWVTEK